jgi:hypothetical protein
MKKIVIMSRGEGTEDAFVQLLEALFPECDVSVVLREQERVADGESDQEIIKGL